MARFAWVRRVFVLGPVLLAPYLAHAGPDPRSDPPTIQANDNRRSAGNLEDGVLTIRLEVRLGRWYPEADDGPSAVVAVFAEEGQAPQIPGPLLRVPAGTELDVTVTNRLDTAIAVRGLATRPATAPDSVVLGPGQVHHVRFAAGAPGTYVYWADAPIRDVEDEQQQLAGALVVDAPGAPANDRVFVMNIWSETVDSSISRKGYLEAVAINGKSWPYTERLDLMVGDSTIWRWVNASTRNHPMHMHGFYFRVDAHGSALADTTLPVAEQRLAVTENLSPRESMRMVWAPTRPGNWLFHCHIVFHVVPDVRMPPTTAAASPHYGHGGGDHMGGLVLGIRVQPRGDETDVEAAPARRLRLLVQQRQGRGRAPQTMGYVLERSGQAVASDSAQIPGTPIILRRGEPTAITVVNRLDQPTAVHWHGIELGSYSDGVAGWSGAGDRVAPPIAPGDSFVAQLRLPRAGTFIYHAHLNDLAQLTSGLYGPIVVLEPTQKFDPATDHIFVLGWDGRDEAKGGVPNLLLNGDSVPPPLTFKGGTTHRFRFINIGPAFATRFSLWRSTEPMTWRALAKDGAALPPDQATERPAVQLIRVGETYDFTWRPPASGDYELRVGDPEKSLIVQQVRVEAGRAKRR